ncbi:hypothetical protein [Methylophaga frappieri]|uniref:hypothetical protein n=1 Tax=Methylophaga frappieri (strain ATCC BAA-2434 / DSM 25690 / JAM7) TaxID=754477 RepID=UPI001930DE81|nr:hypothetical protein [Methylophaga frappieri]
MLDGAGVGSWPIGLSALFSCCVAILAVRCGDNSGVDFHDWLVFMWALLAFPLWWLVGDPVVAVVILTLVDVSGFIPTIRQIRDQPDSESAWFFTLFAIRNGLVLLALEHYSLTTALFPAVIGIACLIVVGCLLYFRGRY